MSPVNHHGLSSGLRRRKKAVLTGEKNKGTKCFPGINTREQAVLSGEKYKGTGSVNRGRNTREQRVFAGEKYKGTGSVFQREIQGNR